MNQPVLRVLMPGPLTTVQDGGRPAARRFGVPEGGAMDNFALRAANLLVGNAPEVAALEITLGGLALEVLAPCLVAVSGSTFDLRRAGRELPLWTACALRAGERLEIGVQRRGARAYLALAGGIAAPLVLGGRGTDLGGSFGGHHGRALRSNDMLCRAAAAASAITARPGAWLSPQRRLAYSPEPTLRMLWGPHARLFAPQALAALLAEPYQVIDQSSRMGYRLEGAPLATRAGATVRSLGVMAGVIQVPPGGQPILLMADAQTTGGYPIIATVIGADLPLAAQLLPGNRVRFAVVTLAQAHAALAAQRALLALPPDDDDIGAPI